MNTINLEAAAWYEISGRVVTYTSASTETTLRLPKAPARVTLTHLKGKRAILTVASMRAVTAQITGPLNDLTALRDQLVG